MQLRQFLTIREKQIFELLVKNYDTESIAKKLNISSKTVRNHISNVIQKLGVKGRSQAIIELIKMQEIKIFPSSERNLAYRRKCRSFHFPQQRKRERMRSGNISNFS